MAAEKRRGVVFDHPIGSAVLDGAERANLSTTTSAMVELTGACEHADELLALVRTSHDRIESAEDFDAFLGGYHERGVDTLLWEGAPIDVHDVRVNTMVATGSPIFAVMGYLDAFCERHAFVEAADAGWFRDVVDQGLRARIMRPGHGWEDVMALCDAVAAAEPQPAEPIVTYSSFLPAFPSASIAGRDPEAWGRLAPEQQWSDAVARLRAGSPHQRIAPDQIRRRLGAGASAFDLALHGAAAHQARLRTE